jgi:signal transduction histidine kinase
MFGRLAKRVRRPGIQVRSAVAAIAVLAVVVGVASAALVLLLQRSLVAGIDATARARAAGIAAQVHVTDEGKLVAVGDLNSAVTAMAARRTWVQVLDRDRTVIADSGDIHGMAPLTQLHPSPGQVQQADQHMPFDDDLYRVIARGGTSGGHPFTVLVGQSLGSVQDTTGSVLSLLVVGIPVLLLSLGAATFVFASRSLRPVEAIRRTVASITERDLSERVAVPEANDEVSRLAVTMNAMLERLQQAQGTQRQFVADASHELRSPIATLITSAEIHLAHPDNGDLHDFPTAVLEESQRLQRLVQDLLLLARADERDLHSHTGDVDLDDIVDAERQRVTAISTLRADAEISPVRVHGDQHQIRQVIRNLADNAVQHARTRVEFDVHQVGDSAVVEVFNDGEGIDPADRERVFDRFVRLQESRDRASGGTGLGLAIVREIVSAHHGQVSVVDDPDGTRFRLVLPMPPGSPSS